MFARVLPVVVCALLLTACAGPSITGAPLARGGALQARGTTPVPAPSAVAPAAPGVATGIQILRPDATRASFQLKATIDAQLLVVSYQGMPGDYKILSATLAGVALDTAGRQAAAAALTAGAASAGRQMMIVEEIAEALAAAPVAP